MLIEGKHVAIVGHGIAREGQPSGGPLDGQGHEADESPGTPEDEYERPELLRVAAVPR